jgi:hypothetical protein
MDKKKKCYSCKIEKSTENFHKNKSRNDGLEAMCKSCWSVYNKKRRGVSSYKAKFNSKWFRDAQYRKKYNLSAEQYDQMRDSQENKCCICKKDLAADRQPSVDHCHSTGKVRGILCNNCNAGLGFFNDNKDSLLAAVEYLSKS